MLQYTFRLSETFFQISTPKAEKKWGWNATSSHSHGQFLPVDTAPMPCIVLDLHEVPGGLSSLGVFAFGRLGCYLKFPWKFDHWNYPIVIEYIFPFSNLVFFSLTQKTSGFSFVLNARMGWSDVVRVIDSLKQRVLGDVWDMPVVPRNTTVWISKWFW